VTQEPRRDPRTDPTVDPAQRTEEPPVAPLGAAPERDDGDAPRYDDPPPDPKATQRAAPAPGGASASTSRDPDRDADAYADRSAGSDQTATATEQPRTVTATEPPATVTATEPPDVSGRTEDDRTIDRDPSSERVAPSAGPGAATDWSSGGGLLPDDDLGSYQHRWDEVQVRFIDEPRQSVREADDLVSEITRRIAERFSDARQDLEPRWEGGTEPTTEELRQALQRYRDFFQRLVAR
jgi:hypothetical protein